MAVANIATDDPLLYEACSKSQEMYFGLIYRVTKNLYYTGKFIEFKKNYPNQLNVLKSQIEILQHALPKCFSNSTRKTIGHIKVRLKRAQDKLNRISTDFETMQKNDYELFLKEQLFVSNNTDPDLQFRTTNGQLVDSQDPEQFGINDDQYPMECESKTTEVCQLLEECSSIDSDVTMIDSPVKSYHTLTNYVAESLNLPSSSGGAATKSTSEEQPIAIETPCFSASQTNNLRNRDLLERSNGILTKGPLKSAVLPSSETDSLLTAATSFEKRYDDNDWKGPKAKKRRLFDSDVRYHLRTRNYSEYSNEIVMKGPLVSPVLPTSQTVAKRCGPPSKPKNKVNEALTAHTKGKLTATTAIKAVAVIPKKDSSKAAPPVAKSVIPRKDSSKAAPPIAEAAISRKDSSKIAPPVAESAISRKDSSKIAPPVAESAISRKDSSKTAPPIAEAAISRKDSSKAAPPVAESAISRKDSSKAAPPIAESAISRKDSSKAAPPIAESVISRKYSSKAEPPVAESVIPRKTSLNEALPIAESVIFRKDSLRSQNVSQKNIQATFVEAHESDVLTQNNFSMSSLPNGQKTPSLPSGLQDGDSAGVRTRHSQVFFSESNNMFSDDLLPPNFWKLPLEDVVLPTEMIDEIDLW